MPASASAFASSFGWDALSAGSVDFASTESSRFGVLSNGSPSLLSGASFGFGALSGAGETNGASSFRSTALPFPLPSSTTTFPGAFGVTFSLIVTRFGVLSFPFSISFCAVFTLASSTARPRPAQLPRTHARHRRPLAGARPPHPGVGHGASGTGTGVGGAITCVCIGGGGGGTGGAYVYTGMAAPATNGGGGGRAIDIPYAATDAGTRAWRNGVVPALVLALRGGGASAPDLRGVRRGRGLRGASCGGTGGGGGAYAAAEAGMGAHAGEVGAGVAGVCDVGVACETTRGEADCGSSVG